MLKKDPIVIEFDTIQDKQKFLNWAVQPSDPSDGLKRVREIQRKVRSVRALQQDMNKTVSHRPVFIGRNPSNPINVYRAIDRAINVNEMNVDELAVCGINLNRKNVNNTVVKGNNYILRDKDGKIVAKVGGKSVLSGKKLQIKKAIQGKGRK